MAQKKKILRNDFQTPSTPSKSFPKVGVIYIIYLYYHKRTIRFAASR